MRFFLWFILLLVLLTILVECRRGRRKEANKQKGKKRREMRQAIREARKKGRSRRDGKKVSMKLLRSKKDKTNKEHVRVQQEFNGAPVFGAHIIKHEQDGVEESYSGYICEDFDLVGDFDLEAETAKALAKKEELKATYPEGSIFPNYRDTEQAEVTVYCEEDPPVLAYLISFLVELPEGNASRPFMIIDAKTGEKYLNIDTLENTLIGTGPGGNDNIGKYEYGSGGKAKLDVTKDGTTCSLKTPNVITFNNEHNNSLLYGKAAHSFNCDENAVYPASGGDINGAYSPLNDVHRFATLTFNMFINEYNTYPQNWADMWFFVHVGNGYNNAFYNGAAMAFGDCTGLWHPFTTLDIVAHEICHGFTDKDYDPGLGKADANSNLVYAGESGGMNEAFSDMCAKAAEEYDGRKLDPYIGRDAHKFGKSHNFAMRNMENPSSIPPSVDKYDPNFDYSQINVHYSSGIFNKAFYKLASTPGWGALKAFKVFVHANQNYWIPTETFVNGSLGVMNSAADLNLDGNDVCLAFREVGIDWGCATPGSTTTTAAATTTTTKAATTTTTKAATTTTTKAATTTTTKGASTTTTTKPATTTTTKAASTTTTKAPCQAEIDALDTCFLNNQPTPT